MKKFFFSMIFCTAGIIFAQSHFSSQAHLTDVTDVSEISGDGSVYSTGNDGFVIKWANNQGEHYQFTDSEIKLIARNPSNNNEIAIYETDGSTLHRVTVWNWSKFTKKYGFRFTDSITSMTFSAKGTYLICGTASVNGAYFINNATGDLVNKKIKENTGVVNMIQTSNSEKNIAMYSPAGTLTYYNLKNGERTERLNVEKNLTQGCMFNNFCFFAGVRDRTLFVYDARTGSVLGRYQVQNPVLAGTVDNQNLFYIETSGRQISIYKVQNDRNKAVIQPQLVNTTSGLKQDEKIVTASIYENTIIAGSSLGNIYQLSTNETQRVDVTSAISEKMYDQIYDIASVGSDFYFLTPSDIFLSSYDRGEVDRKGGNPGHRNIITYGQNVILWSKNTSKAVQLLNLSTGNLSNLFTPANRIQSLKLYGDKLVEIEGNTTVNVFDLQTNKISQVYLGSGIQDALLYSDNDLYVAKSSASYPTVPLIYINIKTQETVPLSLTGTVAYSLTFTPGEESPLIYGIAIKQDKNKTNTFIFSFDPHAKSFRTISSENGEDSNAFTALYYPVIYTNIGKSLVQSYNLSTNRKFTYKRSASLPVKIARNESRLVILNRDGSISWYNPDMSNYLHDWYLTTDGQWFEF